MVKYFLNFTFLFVLVLLVGLTSCNNDVAQFTDELTDELTIDDIDLGDITEDVAGLTIEGDPSENAEEFGGDRRCFIPVFPVTIDFPDGTSQIAESQEAMREIMQAWRTENQGAYDTRPKLQLPFDAILQDGSSVTFTTEDEIKEAIQACVGDRPHRPKLGDCFRPVFPLVIVFPDGSTQEVDSREAIKEAIIAWKESNPDVEGHPVYQFPIEVTLKNGDVVTVNSKEELREILKECVVKRKKRPHFKNCFTIVFPVTIEFPDGTTADVDGKEALKTLLTEWHDNNPDVDGRPHFLFPFEVELPNGETITVNNKEELLKIIKRCKRKGKKGHDKDGN